MNLIMIVGFLASCVFAADGQVCVDPELVSFFDLVNDLRANTKTSKIYTILKAAQTEFTTFTYFSLQDTTKVNLSEGKPAIDDVIAQIDAATGGKAAMKWAEGLYKASVEFASSW